MNHWTQRSIDMASQPGYLDRLFAVYPIAPQEGRRLDPVKWQAVVEAFNRHDNVALVMALTKLELFPIKDSYVAYFKRDKTAAERNPETINRICATLYDMGLEAIEARCSEPKEANRQMGPLFKRWLHTKPLGVMPVPLDEFIANNEDAVLSASDAQAKAFARERLGYNHKKGLDLVARFNGKYVIGEAKFLTDQGGHQNDQIADAITTLRTSVGADIIKVIILDGVVFIPNKGNLYTIITSSDEDENIMSSLVLHEFLQSL